jgi:hypothetical protein
MFEQNHTEELITKTRSKHVLVNKIIQGEHIAVKLYRGNILQ